MEMEKVIEYKSFTRKIKIPPCYIDKNIFKILISCLDEINKDASERDIKRLRENNKKVDSKLKLLFKDIESNYKTYISIFGEKGEYISSSDSSIIESNKLPVNIKSIIIDNSFYFRKRFKQEPAFFFRISLDFSRNRILDFSINPSGGTINISEIDIHGNDEIWVNGAYDKIYSLFLNHARKKRNFIHSALTYDLILWVLIVPIAFVNLNNIESIFRNHLKTTSIIFYIFLYLYIFLIFTLIYLIIFKYMRWLYPYIEFEHYPKRSYIVHRTIFYTLTLSILARFIYDLARLIIE